jgi:hypothetical protein
VKIVRRIEGIDRIRGCVSDDFPFGDLTSMNIALGFPASALLKIPRDACDGNALLSKKLSDLFWPL